MVDRRERDSLPHANWRLWVCEKQREREFEMAPFVRAGVTTCMAGVGPDRHGMNKQWRIFFSYLHELRPHKVVVPLCHLRG